MLICCVFVRTRHRDTQRPRSCNIIFGRRMVAAHAIGTFQEGIALAGVRGSRLLLGDFCRTPKRADERGILSFTDKLFTKSFNDDEIEWAEKNAVQYTTIRRCNRLCADESCSKKRDHSFCHTELTRLNPGTPKLGHENSIAKLLLQTHSAPRPRCDTRKLHHLSSHKIGMCIFLATGHRGRERQCQSLGGGHPPAVCLSVSFTARVADQIRFVTLCSVIGNGHQPSDNIDCACIFGGCPFVLMMGGDALAHKSDGQQSPVFPEWQRRRDEKSHRVVLCSRLVVLDHFDC